MNRGPVTPRALNFGALKLKALLGGLRSRRSAPPDADAAATYGRQRMFRAALASLELVEIAREEGRAAPRLLDIGGAHGIHARFFRRHIPGVRVDIVDARPTEEPLVFTGRYENYRPLEPYDFIWASHVLEHVQNPGLFLRKLHRDLKPGGWACLTVPPLKHEMTFSHVTLWNAGLLLINLIRSGFECSGAHVATYDYNVSVLVQKTGKRCRSHFDALPPGVVRIDNYFEGRIERLNWSTDSLRPFAPASRVDRRHPPARILADHPRHDFVRVSPDGAAPEFLFLDHATGKIYPVH